MTVFRRLAFGSAVAVLTAIDGQSIRGSAVESLRLEPGRLSACIEFGAVSATYSLLVVLILRFAAEATIKETIEVLPAAIRPRLLAALRLK